MTLWLLRPVRQWEPWYDKMFGVVVRAPTREEARRLASKEAGDEGAAAWTDSSESTCEELAPEGPEGVIIKDFAAA